ncbi:hypothetical protein ScPMuIL_013306 [Solemya velum]
MCNTRYKNCKSDQRNRLGVGQINSDSGRKEFEKIIEDDCYEEKLKCLAKYCRSYAKRTSVVYAVIILACVSRHAIPDRILDELGIIKP